MKTVHVLGETSNIIKKQTFARSEKRLSLHLVGTINDVRASVVTSKMSLAHGAKQQHSSNEQEE